MASIDYAVHVGTIQMFHGYFYTEKNKIYLILKISNTQGKGYFSQTTQ